jgi:DnaJ-class molecular chaperone
VIEMAIAYPDTKLPTECVQRGCHDHKQFESNYCGRHGCKKCYGTGRLRAATTVKVRCHVCSGSGRLEKNG